RARRTPLIPAPWRARLLPSLYEWTARLVPGHGARLGSNLALKRFGACNVSRNSASGQRHDESRTGAALARLTADAAAVRPHNLACQVQPDPGSRHFVRPVVVVLDAKELTEDALAELGGDARSLVGHRHLHVRRTRPRGEAHGHGGSRRRVLQ